MGTQCRLRIWRVFSSGNLPSVTQSLFRDQLSRLFAPLWNIPGPYFDQNWSWYNFKPSCSLLTLRASWLVWCLYRFYQRNKSRCRCKWDVTIEYLTRAIFDSFARGPYYHLFKRHVFILLTLNTLEESDTDHSANNFHADTVWMKTLIFHLRFSDSTAKNSTQELRQQYSFFMFSSENDKIKLQRNFPAL